MTDAFAAAVESYREALARFDMAPGLYADADPRWPEDQDVGVWIDWCDIREVTVPAEEAELEERFGRGTRSAGGGGELRGRRIVNRDRPSVNREPVRVNRAAEGPREVVEMPKGKQGPSDEQLLEVAKTFSVSFTTDDLVERLVKVHGKDAPGYETLHKRLAGMRKRGILTGGRGPGKGAPTVWAVTGRDTKGRPAPGLLVSADAKKAARSLDGAIEPPRPIFNGVMELETKDGQRFVGHLGGLHDRIAAEIDREVKHRTVLALREAADRLEGELKRGAA